MAQRDPPPTDEGWYALHDFRTVDWDAWRDAPERRRQQAIDEGVAYLQSHAAVEDAPEGDSGVYTIVGHKADILILHLRPTLTHLDAAERRFEQTALAEFTEQSTSYVSVTEASGYTESARDYFEGEIDEDSGLYQYIQARIHPDIPDDDHVCFYPMNKRRQPEQNWYQLPFEERAEHMARHGDIGRSYGGKVNQMIASSVGFDDYEWGITLWADDPTDVKDLLNEMRFDASTAEFADFGPFYVGRRFEPTALETVLAGEPIPTDGAVTPAQGDAAAGSPERSGHPHGDADSEGGHPHSDADSEGGHPHGDADDAGGHPHGDADDEGGTLTGVPGGDHPSGGSRPDDQSDADVDAGVDDDIQGKLATLGLFPGQDYDEGTYGLVFYSEADATDLADEVDGLRGNFEHYDTHVLTSVRANEGRAAIASVWETESAADTAAGFLSDLSGVVEGYRGPLGEGEADDGATATDDEADAIRGELADQDIYAGQPHGEDVYAMVLYSEADPDELYAAVDSLRANFDHYDTHVKTAVYDARDDDGRSAVVSIWETEDAANTAGDFLSDLPGIVARAGEESGFGTMGMFYTVEPDHREDFVGTFEDVGDVLADMEGHRNTELLANRDDENDMFIASQWRSKEDAMEFFRSDAFSETVAYGREVLADRPRHVFLA